VGKKGMGNLLAVSSATCIAIGLTLLPTAAFATGNGNGGQSGSHTNQGNGLAVGAVNAGGANSSASRSQPQSSTTVGTQPPSNADQNNTGANDTSSSNQYLSTRNGSPSLNGSGTGQATGKPCAACVGKADNKNPPGQYPNGSDHNAGYECDTNHGIGQSNPAHSGCPTSTTSSTSTTSTTLGSNPTIAGTIKPPTHPTISAGHPNDPGSKTTPTGTVPAATTAAAVPAHGSLAFTGSAAAAETVVGLAALGAGAIMVGMARRRRRESV
jgi:hypothetical protein